MSNTPETIVSQRGLIGYKTLNLSQNTSLLISMNEFVWEPQRIVVSHCMNCGNIPQQQCTCGIYAHAELEFHLRTGYVNANAPLVELELFGVVHQFTKGYRAQYARISKIILPRFGNEIPLIARREALEINYAVPLEIYDVPKDIADRSNPQYYAQSSRIETVEYELVLASADTPEDIRKFATRELRKRYTNKISSQKRRAIALENAAKEAHAQVTLFTAKRDAL